MKEMPNVGVVEIEYVSTLPIQPGATQEVESTVSVFSQEVQAPASYAGRVSVRS